MTIDMNVTTRWRLGLAMMLIGFLPVTSLAAETTKVLHFPADQDLGRLSVEDPSLGSQALETGRDLSFPFGFDPEHVCLSGDWDYVGQAKGDVAVPADRTVRLGVLLRPAPADRSRLSADMRQFLSKQVGTGPTDLSGLSRLDPNDLYHFSVGALVTVRDVERRVLEPISRLTGLRVLDLSRTGITDEQMDFLKPLQSLRALELRGELSIRNSGLAVLKDLPALEYLDLETGTTDVGFQHLSGLRNLRWLRLCTGRTWGPGLAELAKLPRLERLCLWGETGLSDRQVHYLEGLTHLKSLTLWGGNRALTDATLASIGKLTSLEELYFIRVSLKFTDAGMGHLERLKKLRRVGFTSCVLGAEGVQHLANLPNLESIKGLAPTADAAGVLPTFPNLKSLAVNFYIPIPSLGTPVPPEVVSAVGELQGLEDLLLMGGQWSQEDLLVLGKLSHLKRLILCVNDEYGDPVLAEIAELKDLEILDLSGKGVSKRGLNQLQGLTKLRSLTVRPFSRAGPPMDETPLMLSSLKNLKSLWIRGVSLQDADLASLAAMRELEWLTLRDGTFSEAGLRHLQGLKSVEYLTIGDLDCPTGAGLACLAELKAVGNMTLRGRITDAALRQLPALPSLWLLTVETDEIIRPETVAGLRERLPAIQSIEIHEPLRRDGTPAKPSSGRVRSASPRSNRQRSQSRRRR